MTQAGIPRMTLNVGFVNHVQAKLITEIQETRIIWVVRTTNSIDIVLFHQHQVGAHVINTHGLALIGVMVVPIHTANHHFLTVNQK